MCNRILIRLDLSTCIVLANDIVDLSEKISKLRLNSALNFLSDAAIALCWSSLRGRKKCDLSIRMIESCLEADKEVDGNECVTSGDVRPNAIRRLR